MLRTRQAARGALQEDPIQAREADLAVVAVAGPNEVHDTFSPHIVRMHPVPDQAPFQQVVAGQLLQHAQLRLDLRWAKVRRSVRLKLSEWRGQNVL